MTDAIWNGFVGLKKKGVKLRSITEVTPDNISYVKKSMELFETRHTPGLRSNFGIVDRRECLLHSVSRQDKSLSHAKHTNALARCDSENGGFSNRILYEWHNNASNKTYI